MKDKTIFKQIMEMWWYAAVFTICVMILLYCAKLMVM